MAFVVDGAEWLFDGWTNPDIEKALEELIGRVLVAFNRSERVWIGEDLQSRPVFGDFDIWGLMSPESPITLSPEIWQELAAWLGRDCCYLDEDWPNGMPDSLMQIGNEPPVDNVDVAWVHHNVRAGRAIACLGLRREGAFETVTSQGRACVHWVRDEASHRAFWRAAFDIEGDDENTLRRFAPHAFPNLYFHDRAWGGLNRLSGGYAAHSVKVRRYLSVLDDHGCWVFTFPPPSLDPSEPMGPDPSLMPSNQIIERRFHGLNLNVAPENPNVYLDKHCREEREVLIDNTTLYCHWHAKFELHQNRLHIHPPTSESDNKVVIAIFDAHLDLP